MAKVNDSKLYRGNSKRMPRPEVKQTVPDEATFGAYAGPEDEDWITEDHMIFRELPLGRVVCTVPQDATNAQMWVILRREMQHRQFRPNVWFISDHGNAEILTPAE